MSKGDLSFKFRSIKVCNICYLASIFLCFGFPHKVYMYCFAIIQRFISLNRICIWLFTDIPLKYIYYQYYIMNNGSYTKRHLCGDAILNGPLNHA